MKDSDSPDRLVTQFLAQTSNFYQSTTNSTYRVSSLNALRGKISAPIKITIGTPSSAGSVVSFKGQSEKVPSE